MREVRGAVRILQFLCLFILIYFYHPLLHYMNIHNLITGPNAHWKLKKSSSRRNNRLCFPKSFFSVKTMFFICQLGKICDRNKLSLMSMTAQHQIRSTFRRFRNIVWIVIQYNTHFGRIYLFPQNFYRTSLIITRICPPYQIQTRNLNNFIMQQLDMGTF